ncbi:MAG: hypothetical protein JSR80_01265 [Verrucomicrobia bacterium]|nr:hypothetical protein [Verrucomicrobiota bacterium]
MFDATGQELYHFPFNTDLKNEFIVAQGKAYLLASGLHSFSVYATDGVTTEQIAELPQLRAIGSKCQVGWCWDEASEARLPLLIYEDEQHNWRL